MGSRSVNSKGLAFLKIVATTLLMVGLLGGLWTLATWNYDAGALPRSPDPTSGRVYRLTEHDVTVYQTRREHTFYWAISEWSWPIFCIGMGLALIHDWRSGELRREEERNRFKPKQFKYHP